MPGEELDDKLAAGRRLLGLRLRAVRSDRGLVLDELARAAGITKAHLSDCERGRSLPSLQALQALADALDTRVVDLLRGVYPFGNRRRPRHVPGPPRDGRRLPEPE